jgi:hypothetical protein
MKAKLELRLQQMKEAVNQSVANHNGLLGRQLELEETLKHWDELNSPEQAEVSESEVAATDIGDEQY